LHIVFGELAPKSIAIRYPTSTSMAISLPLRVFFFVFRPFIWLLNGFANLILKMFGIKPMSETEVHSEEELKLIIAESEEGGAIEASERELIQNVFDFDNRIVRQVMVPREKITGMNANTSMADAAKIVFHEGYSRYPVYDISLDEIVGIAHTKDIMSVHFSGDGTRTLRDILRPAYFIPETKPIDKLLREMQKKKMQMAVVISEYGGVIGIVTFEDILEELVGEIQDEHDQEQQIVLSIGTHRYQIQARSSLHDINKNLPVPFADSDDFDTLAGVITNQYANAQEGDEMILDRYKIKITKMIRNLPELVEVQLVDLDKDS
jgi:CBS domain containing-hemolysin-like protein